MKFISKRLKQYSVVSFILLLINSITVPGFQSIDEPYWYDPEDCNLNDNTYRTTDHYTLQWWYTDAIFTNNYSTHIGILTIGSKGTNGFFLFQISIYKHGNLLEKRFRFVPTRSVDISTGEPVIRVSGKELFRAYLNDEDKISINLSLALQGLQVDLTLNGLTKGWKGFTGHGMWGCPLPKALVNGTLTIHDDTIPVTGIGYQEHGWNVRRLHRSWYWGKFMSNTTSVVFSQNMKNRHHEDTFIVVVNSGSKNYTSIAREHIRFYHTEYTINHGRRIPTKSVLQIDNENVQIDVTFEVQSIHFSSLFCMQYWRFHNKVTGTISLNDSTETVDDFQIMEVFHYP